MNAPAQRTDEWLAQRVGRITGSRVGAILGLSPFQSRDDVMREMVREHLGAEREFVGNIATDYGNQNEAEALEEYEAISGNMVDSAGLIVHPAHDWLAASPDGLIDDDAGLEIKCPFSGDLKPIEDQPHYYAQIQLCMAVTGRSRWDYFAWAPNAYRLQTLEFDEDWLPGVMRELIDFREEYLETIASEDLYARHMEPLERDMSESDEWAGLAAEYAEIESQVKELGQRQYEIKQKLIAMAGDRKAKGCGLTVFPTTRKGAIDTAALAKATGLDLETYRKEPSTSWTVRMVKEAA